MLEKDNKKIIVSADDFGISQLASENILKLAKAGKLDRVEVMMSRNITPEIARELLASGVKIDIHLHLLEEKILNFWQDHPRVVETGAIKRISLFLYHLLFGDTRPRMVQKKWDSQILEFKKIFGKDPDGISSHEHIHFFPFYFKIIAEIYSQNNLSYIRLGKESFFGLNKISLILNQLRKLNLRLLEKNEIQSSDLMLSFDWLCDNNIDQIFSRIPQNKTVEIVFHPEKEKEFEFLNA